MNLWRNILATLILTLTSHAATAAVFDNAEPSNENTNIVKVFDGFNSQPFYLLLTNNTGYKIECTDSNKLSNMLQGFGLNANAVSNVFQYNIDDPTVFNSHYEDNPSLNCELGDEDLHVVEYPNGESKYFIGFQNNTSLNMVGCQGLLDVMGFDINQAEPISYALAQQYFDISDERDIHCIDGLAPGACGEHENDSIWNISINNGQQGYRCDNTLEVINGAPVCNFNYEAVGSACVAKSCGDHSHNSYWNDSIPNGTQNFICDFGTSSPLGTPACNSTHEADSPEPGGNCMPKNCGDNLHGDAWSQYITNGSQNYSCNYGEVIIAGQPICNSNAMVNGTSCILKNCGAHNHGSYWNDTITNGNQNYACYAGVTSPVGSPVCNSGYASSGDSCISLDSDGDGVFDDADAFPNNADISIDSDGDGYPNEWNESCDGSCQEQSTYILDDMPSDPTRFLQLNSTVKFEKTSPYTGRVYSKELYDGSDQLMHFTATPLRVLGMTCTYNGFTAQVLSNLFDTNFVAGGTIWSSTAYNNVNAVGSVGSITCSINKNGVIHSMDLDATY